MHVAHSQNSSGRLSLLCARHVVTFTAEPHDQLWPVSPVPYYTGSLQNYHSEQPAQTHYVNVKQSGVQPVTFLSDVLIITLLCCQPLLYEAFQN